MLTAAQALELTVKGREERLTQALHQIEHEKASGSPVGKALDAIGEMIGMAASNLSGIDTYVSDLLGDEWSSREAEHVTRLLRSLGYRVSFSLSSSRANERIFINWERKNE